MQMCAYVYVCTCINMCVCIYVCVHVYLCACIYAYTRLEICGEWTITECWYFLGYQGLFLAQNGVLSWQSKQKFEHSSKKEVGGGNPNSSNTGNCLLNPLNCLSSAVLYCWFVPGACSPLLSRSSPLEEKGSKNCLILWFSWKTP